MKKRKALFGILTLTLTLTLITNINEPLSAQLVYPREETYIIAVHQGEKIENPDNWNTLTPAMGNKDTYGYQACVVEYFFYVNLETGELIPWLAESYSYSSDYMSLTVSLREGVTWSDGYPFTADDVVFTYNDILLNPDYTSQISAAGPIIDQIETVNKIDDYTVEFVLVKPNTRFHMAIDVFPTVTAWHSAVILPQHIWQGQNPIEFKNYPPIGTGPYKLSSVGENYIAWERRDDWWATDVFGIRPAPRYVIFESLGSEDETAFKFAANEIDYAMFATLSYGSYQSISLRNPETMIWWATSPYSWTDPCPRVLFTNDVVYPYNMVDVRRAISYMIDRDELIALGYENTTSICLFPYPPYGALSPYTDTLTDLITEYEVDVYDVTKADAILTNLGFTKGSDGVWVTPNGTRLAPSLVTWAEHKEIMRATAVVAEQLRRAGIDATVKPLSTGTYFTEIMLGHYDMTYSWLCPGDTDPIANLYLFHSSRSDKPIGQMVGTYEAAHRYVNLELDEIIDDIAAASPVTEKDTCIQLFGQAMEIWYRDLPVVLLVQTPAIMPFNNHYWTGWPSGYNPWIHPLIWASHMVMSLVGYKSPTTNQWVGGIRPTTITYTTVYFTKDTAKFRGLDLVWYGPFEKGDASRVTNDDADFLIANNYATLTPVTEIPELAEIMQDLSSISSSLSDVTGVISSLTGTLTTIMAVQAVTAILVIIAIVLVLRKKS